MKSLNKLNEQALISSQGKESALFISMLNIGSTYCHEARNAVFREFMFRGDPLRNSSIQSPDETAYFPKRATTQFFTKQPDIRVIIF
jgi:hypothetical protein